MSELPLCAVVVTGIVLEGSVFKTAELANEEETSEEVKATDPVAVVATASIVDGELIEEGCEGPAETSDDWAGADVAGSDERL